MICHGFLSVTLCEILPKLKWHIDLPSPTRGFYPEALAAERKTGILVCSSHASLPSFVTSALSQSCAKKEFLINIKTSTSMWVDGACIFLECFLLDCSVFFWHDCRCTKSKINKNKQTKKNRTKSSLTWAGETAHRLQRWLLFWRPWIQFPAPAWQLTTV